MVRGMLVPLLVLLQLGAASRALGQLPESGQRVRIVSPATPAQAGVSLWVGFDADSVFLERSGEAWALSRESIASIEAFQGTRGRAGRGAVIGALLVGVVLGQDMLRNPSQCQGSGNYGQICAMALGGAMALGAGAGALIGLSFRREVWAPVSLEPSR